MNEDLRMRYEEIQVSMASRGQLYQLLPPHLWEDLRQRLQRVYRKATGEQTATIHIEI